MAAGREYLGLMETLLEEMLANLGMVGPWMDKLRLKK